MAPPGLSVHSSRIARRPHARGYAQAPHVDDAVDRLTELAPPVILFGYSSRNYVIERHEEESLRTRLQQKVPGTTVFLPTLAGVAALRALKLMMRRSLFAAR